MSITYWWFPRFMSIVFWWWLPNLLCIVGLLFCAIQGWRQRSLGLALLAIFFAFNISGAIVVVVREHEYVRDFVQHQIGPNRWTAPVQQVDIAAPFTYGLLVLAAIFLSRRLTVRTAIKANTV